MLRALKLVRVLSKNPSGRGLEVFMSETQPESGGTTPLFALFDEASGDVAVGELEAAVEKYRRCIEIDPLFFDGWHALGMALMKTGRFPEAIEAGLKATQLQPNDQLAWSSLSMFYVRNHQIAEAESAGVKARILSWGGKIAKEEDRVESSAESPAS
jgi:tetratricopeptide (TPR) repeat protein